MSGLLGVIGALALLVLPGSWLAFAGRSTTLTLRERVALAVLLSPVVVLAQFYLLRGIGVSFDVTVVATAVLNLAALALVARRMRDGAARSVGSVVAVLTGAAVPVAYLAIWLHDAQQRANFSHGWLHNDIIYMLANGALRPEEPQLAGVRLAYPWLAHVFQAAFGTLLDLPPSSYYLLVHAVWLVAICVLVAETVRRLGGDLLAQAMAPLWLAFGVNAAGYVGRALAPEALRQYAIWGDHRFTPWVRKFGIFEPTVLGIGLFAAVMYVAVAADAAWSRRQAAWLMVVLLLGTALLYPVLFPAALAVAGAQVVVAVVRRSVGGPVRTGVEILAPLAGGILAVVAAVTHVALVTVDRESGSGMSLATLGSMREKTVSAAVSLFPLLIAILPGLVILWRRHLDRAALLIVSALASMIAFIVLDIHHYANEYKFIFTAAIALTPLAAVGAGRLLPAGRWFSVPLYAAVAVALVAPAVDRLRDVEPSSPPALDLRRFSLALAPEHKYSALTTAVRDSAPARAVIVSRDTPFDWVTVTRRAVFVPYDTAFLHGIGLEPDYLLKRVRGYPPVRVDERRQSVRRMYEGNPAQRDSVLRRVAGLLRRPLILITRAHEDSVLHRAMQTSRWAAPLYQDPRVAAWVVHFEAASGTPSPATAPAPPPPPP